MGNLERSHTPKGRRSREHILGAAERLFAARGFHGTSMRDVAEAADVPVAGVVYHFRRKEALYAAVLTGIAAELEAALGLHRLTPPAAVSPGPVDVASYTARLDGVVAALVAWSDARPDRVRLLLRELLDNPSRVARAARLPLAPVLQSIAAFLEEGAVAGVFQIHTAETAVLHVVGAISYVVVARPTVRRIVGADRERATARTYAQEALAFARRAVGLPPDPTTEVRHGPDNRDLPRPPRARTHRRAHDRHR
jgi:AcrR family transcriptional regulator